MRNNKAAPTDQVKTALDYQLIKYTHICAYTQYLILTVICALVAVLEVLVWVI